MDTPMTGAQARIARLQAEAGTIDPGLGVAIWLCLACYVLLEIFGLT